jgi:hypothetical protein
MPIESSKRFNPDPETTLGSNAAPSLQAASPVLDTASIAALRTFFELLDAWDQEENTDEN